MPCWWRGIAARPWGCCGLRPWATPWVRSAPMPWGWRWPWAGLGLSRAEVGTGAARAGRWRVRATGVAPTVALLVARRRRCLVPEGGLAPAPVGQRRRVYRHRQGAALRAGGLCGYLIGKHRVASAQPGRVPKRSASTEPPAAGPVPRQIRVPASRLVCRGRVHHNSPFFTGSTLHVVP